MSARQAITSSRSGPAAAGAVRDRAALPNLRRWLLLWAACLLAIATLAAPAAALQPITLTGEQDWLEVNPLGEAYAGRGDVLQIETAPGADGATARMAVRASAPGSNPNWMAFALHNPTGKAIELWLTADRYSPIGSGVVWPDLDVRRIASVSHSAGFAPERVRNDRVDVFRLTIERGQTVTYVAELASERFSRITLWKPIEFEQRQRERQLFNGIMLGITGLLAVFLTAVFAANHKAIFPTAGLVAWCALALLCVDFGFWHKLFQMRPEDNAQYRAAGEAALAASLVIFLAAFLRVNLWSGFARTLFVVWIVAQLAIVAVAVLDPRLAATVARLSLGVIGVLGLALILVLSVRGLDRALALMPVWILFLVWLFGAAVTMTGRMSGEFAISGLVSGLVLILVLIGFTVTQYAFRSAEPVLGSGAGGQQLRLAAMDRAGVAFWEWNVRRDELRLDPDIEMALGLSPGQLPTKVDQLLAYLHPADRERFRLELHAIRERDGGALRTGIRIRHADSSYRWLDFEGASVPTSDRRNQRCVGLVRDNTDAKRAQERLLHNAVYDSLTSLPNRELFLDRLSSAMQSQPGAPPRPLAVFVVDVDRFRSINASFGLVVGDSIILTVSRRLSRVIGTDGAIARIGGDQFALYLADRSNTRDIATFAEGLRLSLRSPIRIAGQEIVLTGSIGISINDGSAESARELMRDAEAAMHRAKRQGSDRAEIFSPEMESERAERQTLERELAGAIEARGLTVLYQPVVALSNDELIGFEAVVRWKHPRLGVLAPADFVPLAEGSGLVQRLGSFVLGRTMTDLARWQQELPRPEHPLFVTVNVSSRQLIAPELVQELRHAKARAVLPAGSIKLAIAEPLVMDNPEQASHVLDQLHDAGIETWLDRFGTGYSSLAYLGRFPFDAFKIDKALVEWSSHGERDAAMVRSIVAVAHELGRKVIGDGVETPEDAAFLRSIGCQYAQGFHYGEPMSIEEVDRLLRLIRKSERRMRRRGLVRGQEKKKAGDAADVPPLAADAVAVRTGPPPTPAAPPTAGKGQRRPPPALAPITSGRGAPAGASQQQVRTGPAGPRTEGGAAPRPYPVAATAAGVNPPPPGPSGPGPLPPPPGNLSAPPPSLSPPLPPGLVPWPNGPRERPPPAAGPTPPHLQPVHANQPRPDPTAAAPGAQPPPAPGGEPVRTEPTVRPFRAPPRRPDLSALSPAVARSLERLAGKTGEAMARAEAARAAAAESGFEQDNEPLPPTGTKAAE